MATAKKNLLIVESPTKVKAIKRFLGSGYEVAASNGHVRDLPKSQMGIDTEHDFEPRYITIRGKGELLSALRKQVKKADKVYLATDPDREGEAISWHLLYALKLNEEPEKVSRITFNEITKGAVKESIKHARDIDMNLVDAQQARRILDRVVGYRISPLLWSKIKRGLSAGRVQSVALRIICDREEEIAAFIPQEYWTLDALLTIEGTKDKLIAHYFGEGEGKKDIPDKATLDALIAELQKETFKISSVKKNERMKKPPLPFTTSTMQQEASKALNFSTLKTMRIAQQLYEGIDVKGAGTVGLITYLRTDSTRVSEEAQTAASAYIKETYGDAYVAETPVAKKASGKIQDAHEAIRPTDVSRTPVLMKEYLTRDQFRLYQLIWRRFMASRMTPSRYENISVRIDAGVHRFKTSSSKMVFDGYQSVYTQEDDGEDVRRGHSLRENISEESVLTFNRFDHKQHFTQPPAHYTEASLVHDLESLGIGRPSTYAPTISTILARRYITKEGRNIFVTELGEIVNKLMKENFPSIVDVNFTANMESKLDKVEDGEVKWKSIIEEFYPELDKAVNEAEKNLEKIVIADEETEEVCENCGRHMVIKYGPHGRFLACPGFPECRNTKPYYEKIGVACPKCGKDVVLKKTKKGRKYYGCIDNPECDFMVWQKPSAVKCPKCGGLMVEKGNKLVCTVEGCGHNEEKKEEDNE